MTTSQPLVLTLALLLSFSTNAQDFDEDDFEPSRPDISNSYVTFDAFSAFVFHNPRYTIGYVRPIHRRWMLGLEIGYGNRNIMPSYYTESFLIGDEYRLFELRQRTYFKLKPSSKFQPFLSAELFYFQQKDHFNNTTGTQRNDRFINFSNGPSISYQRADYKREKYGVNFNIGLFLTLFGDFGSTIDAGLGIRNRNIQYSNIFNPGPVPFPDNDNFATNPLNDVTGNMIGMNVTLNAKIFYKF